MANFFVPRCFKFNPTERELVEYFLVPKALGLDLPYGHEILERPLYGEEAAPWKVFNDQDPWQFVDDTLKKKIIYVFSRVIAKSGQSKSRTVRTAGCGTWDGKAVGKPIRDLDKNVIGSKRAFTFKPKKEFEDETRGKWIMHEYSLVSNREYKDADLVVCRISNHVETVETNEDDGSGLDSDDGSNSGEKTGKRKANKRGRRGGVGMDLTGNQEDGEGVVGGFVGGEASGSGLTLNGLGATDSANVSGDLRLHSQEMEGLELTLSLPYGTDPAKVSRDMQLHSQETTFPSRTDFAQQNENQEVVPYSAATPQDLYYSDEYERPTPILYDFFK